RMTKFEKYPKINISDSNKDIWEGSSRIVEEIKAVALTSNVIVFECYPGTDLNKLYSDIIQPLIAYETIDVGELIYTSDKITGVICDILTDDDVFGAFSPHDIEEFLDVKKVQKVKENLSNTKNELTVIYGTGASLVEEEELLIYVDVTRWEIQDRFKKGMSNWKANNQEEQISRKIKRSYFFEWPLADRLKKELFNQVDFWLDGNDINNPKMIS